MAKGHRTTKAKFAQPHKVLEAVNAATLAIRTGLSPGAVLQTIVEQARNVTNARYAALGIGSDPTRPFDPWVFSGMDEATAQLMAHPPRPLGLLGAVVREGQTIRLRDVAKDPRFVGFPARHPVVTTFLGVPIRHEDDIIGNLYLADKDGGEEFTDDDEEAVDLMAAHAAIAYRQAQLYHQLRTLNEELEQRVADRTAELEVSNKELGAFAYSVSHDLRAPLRHIDGLSQALLEDYADKLDETGKQYLQLVRASSQSMAQLIDDILHLSRVTRAEMRREPVDLSQIATEIAARLHSLEPERDVVFQIAPGVAASGDAHLLRLVLENLLGNAWKFTSKKQRGKIEFGVLAQGDDRVYYVRDNGAGFDGKYVGKLFGAFQRLHTADEFPGTGIGLATVQRIIHRHGGRVWAEAAVDQGATLYFTLG